MECTEKQVSIECEFCGKNFSVIEARSDEARFCSMGCMGDWRSENVYGESHPQYRGDAVKNYGPNWRHQRRYARRRDQYRCQICGITEPEYLVEHGRQLDVHHITPIREFRDGGDLDHEAANSLENLITLCRSCHSEWEQMAPLRPDTVQPASD
jgi:5-methylcytosine-specific restriction endonuclease McrA